MSKRLVIIILFLIGVASSATASNYVNYTTIVKGKSFLQCIEVKNLKEIVEGTRSFFLTGIPEINFTGINEPINIDEISMKVEDTSLSGKLSSVGMRGLSKFIGKANAAPNVGTMMSMQWVLGFSELRIIGKYKIRGNVFSLDIEGSGTFWMIMSNVTVEAQQKLALGDISKKEKPLYIVEQQMDMKYGKMRMRLNNLFNGDRVLGEAVNQYLNENHRELFKEYKKDIFKPVGELVSTIVDDALAILSQLNVLF